MKYIVQVHRTQSAHAKIEVEADNAEEAKHEAIDQAGDADFCIDDSEYDAEWAQEVGEEYDECGADIPVVDGGGLENKHHHKSCSLYDPKKK